MIKKILKIITHRVTITAICIAVQLALLICLIFSLSQNALPIYVFFEVLSVIIVIGIINGTENPMYKITWIVMIMAMPLLGGAFYLLWGNRKRTKKVAAQMRAAKNMVSSLTPAHDSNIEKLRGTDSAMGRIASYISNTASFPLYTGTQMEYYPLGDDAFPVMINELERAEKFIFLEYFILNKGIMWDTVLDILARKADAGVEVCLMYDDFGSLFTLQGGYKKKMERLGIKCRVFNPMRPRMSAYMNYRDHRKICVIDGNVGFSGGINLADEYINKTVKYGHWKDTAFMLKGASVWSLTVQFLEMWYFADKHKNGYHEFLKYMPNSDFCKRTLSSGGYVQPFGESPLDDINVAENTYMNIISNATKYVYITTPYLILDNEMIVTLETAARSGVDVRIITPRIPDKWYAQLTARSYYRQLTEAGVRIFEYLPGFVHAKEIVSDDKIAVVGTINMDFRSFYLHFECGTVFYDTPMSKWVKDDIENILEQCEEITVEWCERISLADRMKQSVLRVLAPML